MLSYHFLCTHPLAEVFEPDFLKELDGYSVYDGLLRHLSKAPAKDHLNRRLYADVKTVLGDSDLPKVTCMAELAGVQVPGSRLSIAWWPSFRDAFPPT